MYAQTLRAIGQDLEKQDFSTFELKIQEESALVRGKRLVEPVREPIQADSGGLRAAWARFSGRSQSAAVQLVPEPASEDLELSYRVEDVERLESEGEARRKSPDGVPDANTLSQMLRAIGSYIDRKGGRLITLKWRGNDIVFQYWTQLGLKTDTLENSSIYDLCVHLYKRRHTE